MAEYTDESPAIVAKEMTLAAMGKVVIAAGQANPEGVGENYGKLYKIILKHVREAIHDKKYD